MDRLGFMLFQLGTLQTLYVPYGRALDKRQVIVIAVSPSFDVSPSPKLVSSGCIKSRAILALVVFVRYSQNTLKGNVWVDMGGYFGI